MRAFLAALAALLLLPAAVAAEVAPVQLAVPNSSGSYYKGISRDGRSIFAIDAPYTDSSHTSKREIGMYRSRGGVADFVVFGDDTSDPAFGASSDDGSRVFYTTLKPISDVSFVDDLFVWQDGVSTHVSPGTGASDGGPLAAGFIGTNADGSCVVFQTQEQLSNLDTDSDVDIYRRCGNSTILLTGTASNTAAASTVSRDTNRVVFWTDSPVLPADTDFAMDQYAWDNGTLSLLTLGPTGGNAPNAHAQFVGASADATHVVFRTTESLVAADTDSAEDLYVSSPAGVELLAVPDGGGNGEDAAGFVGSSADGSHIFIATKAALVPGDVNNDDDVYDRTGGHTVLVPPLPKSFSHGTYWVGASADGSKVFFKTDRSLTKEDTDGYQDIYERSATGITLISTGPTAAGQAGTARDYAVAEDGNTVVFDTDERLVPEDTNDNFNLYARRRDKTFLLDGASSKSQFVAASPDAQRIVLSSLDLLDPTEYRAVPEYWGTYSATLPPEPDPEPPAPPSAPAPTPAGTTPPPAATQPALPALTLGMALPARTARLARFLRSGVRVGLTVNHRAFVRVQLLLPRALQKKLHLSTRTLAAASTSIDRTGALRLGVPRRLRAKLTKLHKLRLTVSAQGIDSAAHKQTVTRTFTVHH